MKLNQDINKRKSIRSKGYDYSREWLYFITIWIKDRLCLFWKIKDNNLKLFDSWIMIERYWLELENKFENVKLHNFIVMPNHFHGVIELKNYNKMYCRGEPCVRPKNNDWNNFDTNIGVNTRFTPTGGKFEYNKNWIPWIIQYFKSVTTNAYIKNVHKNKWLPFNKKLWQRNYYEHIIKNEKAFSNIINYINNNPLKWNEDKFYYISI